MGNWSRNEGRLLVSVLHMRQTKGKTLAHVQAPTVAPLDEMGWNPSTTLHKNFRKLKWQQYRVLTKEDSWIYGTQD